MEMTMTPTLLFYRTHPNAIPPKVSTQGSACYDLSAHLAGEAITGALVPRDVTIFSPSNTQYTLTPHQKYGGSGTFTESRVVIPPFHRAIIPTGIIFDIPSYHSVRIHSRSGLSIKKGFVLANAEGVVDEDYIHEVKLLMINLSNEDMIVEHGDRLAQAELVETIDHVLLETNIQPTLKTDRIGGLGTTGVKQQ
jgi:dUTP pyrophosphatase